MVRRMGRRAAGARAAEGAVPFGSRVSRELRRLRLEEGAPTGLASTAAASCSRDARRELDEGAPRGLPSTAAASCSRDERRPPLPEASIADWG